MKYIVLDIETTVVRLEDNIIDNSPFNSKNKIVSVNWRKIENGEIGPNNVSVFYHKEYNGPVDPKPLQDALDWADVIIAHNAKYDLLYLIESGFRVPTRIYDTMIAEYILARGNKISISLEETAIRRKTTLKKSDLVDELFHSGVGFDEMPLETVLEYADADVLSCGEIFLSQLEDFDLDLELNYRGIKKTKLHQIVTLMNDMLWFILEIEKNGIKIDLDALHAVEKEYINEKEQLEKRMYEIVSQVMGDTPINLSSGDDMSTVVYSRRVKDKKKHKEVFNLGKDENGNAKYPPRMRPEQFTKAVLDTTEKVYRTTAEHCFECKGKGVYQKYKKDGSPHKNTNKCKVCEGTGIVYTNTGTIAGFKLLPSGPSDASIGGFKVDKDTISLLILQAESKNNSLAVEFLKAKIRLNAVNVYLNSFVEGIKFWTRPNGILHAGFNQTVASTGRLSSSTPNFQNQPRGTTFPVRRCVVSRFENGEVIEADFSGLEFVTAAELSRDPVMIKDIEDGLDVHKRTASITLEIPQDQVTKPQRTDAKPDTFAPLYGATGYDKPPHIKRYYEQFFVIYPRHKQWQEEQMDSVMSTGLVVTPSGREYFFPFAKRTRNGKVTNSTQIVNWPVQGFATGDIVPLACVRALRKFRELGLRSLLILTVHDSILVDCYPGEREQVCEALTWAMTEINEEIQERWGYKMYFKLKIEIEAGKNWLDKKVI